MADEDTIRSEERKCQWNASFMNTALRYLWVMVLTCFSIAIAAQEAPAMRFSMNLLSPYSTGGETDLAKPAHNHDWPGFIANTAASVGVAFGAKTLLKSVIHEERPDHSDNKSFPSGHASMAFAAARSLDKEFRHDNIWIPIAGYAAATAIGVERITSNRHHWYDVVGGAAIGIASTELTWWLSGLLFKTGNVAVGVGPGSVALVVNL